MGSDQVKIVTGMYLLYKLGIFVYYFGIFISGMDH